MRGDRKRRIVIGYVGPARHMRRMLAELEVELPAEDGDDRRDARHRAAVTDLATQLVAKSESFVVKMGRFDDVFAHDEPIDEGGGNG